MHCLPDIGDDEYPAIMMLVPTDDGTYAYSCARGHSGLTILQQDRFQLLFEIGIHAIVDGYPREAVADFAASLERFYEYYFRFYAAVMELPPEAIDKTWSSVARQSERQFGLFLSCYLTINRSPPPTISSNTAAFRNEVIHKGRIPTREKAVDFGETVAGLIQPIMADMFRNSPDVLSSIEMYRIFAAAKGRQAATLYYPTYLSFDGQNKSFNEAITQAALPPWSYR